jgi:riboflavin synthase
MFTGIIEAVGTIKQVISEQSNRHFQVSSPVSHQLRVDQSVSHNGVCLTVTKVENGTHWVTAVDETLKKSNLGKLVVDNVVNIERCMVANGRFDGHVVQGHVDQVGNCTAIKEVGGSWIYDFEYDPALGNITVEKGSISINGISLTCFNSRDNGFTVTIIPYTYEHTNFKQLKEGDNVNLEFDIIGKYVQRILAKR